MTSAFRIPSSSVSHCVCLVSPCPCDCRFSPIDEAEGPTCASCHDKGDPLWLPRPGLTPGDVQCPESYRDMAQALVFEKVERSVGRKAQREVFKRYGIPWNRRLEFDLDHLVPLSLGGTNAIENLWPHAYDSRHPPRMKVRQGGGGLSTMGCDPFGVGG